jgi:hypothetical protein
VRQRRPRRGAGQSRGPRRPREDAPAETVEQPRTDEQGVSPEGQKQPVVEPQAEETPAAAADAPAAESSEAPKPARKPAAKKPTSRRRTKKQDDETSTKEDEG